MSQHNYDDKKKGKVLQQLEPKRKSFKGNFFKETCKYCKKYGYKVDDCYFLKKKLEKQGTFIALACFESNVIDVPSNTWSLDSCATIRVLNSLQGFTSLRKPSDIQVKVVMVNGARVPVVEIRVASLILPSEHFNFEIKSVCFSIRQM